MSTTKSRYETTISRVAAGLATGVLTGAVLTSLAFEIVFHQRDLGFVAFPFALVGFVAGLTLLGAPCWWVLHGAGLRSWPWAMGLGAALGGLAAPALLALYLRPVWSFEVVVVCGAVAAAGAVICGATGYAIWRAAYWVAPQASGGGDGGRA